MESNFAIIFSKTLIYFSKLEAPQNGIVPVTLLNKWIDLSAESTDGLFDEITGETYSQLSVIGEYVSNYEENGFTERNGIYTLADEKARTLICEMIGYSGVENLFDKASFTVDLTKKINPAMEIYEKVETMKNSSDGMYEYYLPKQEQKHKLSLSNINNTIVNFPTGVEIYGPEELMGIM